MCVRILGVTGYADNKAKQSETQHFNKTDTIDDNINDVKVKFM